MMKRWLGAVLALLLAVSMTASAEYDWGSTYDAYYLAYDEQTVAEYQRVDYAESDGVLLYMHDDTTEINVSLPMRSDAAELDDLCDLQLEWVEAYGKVVGESTVADWYAPWDATQPGRRLTYSFTYGDDVVYDVVKYMAVLNDDKYVMVEIVDGADRAQDVAARLEGGFLSSLQVLSFPVDAGGSAFLTGVNEKDGEVYLTLQAYDVALNEDSTAYEVRIMGEPQVVRLSDAARIMAPQDRNTGMLVSIELSEKAIQSFIDEYRTFNDRDCVFNILFSEGEVRWMTYSYLY